MRFKRRAGKWWPAAVAGEHTTDGSAHWWVVDLPPGSYKFIIDLWRVKVGDHRVHAVLQWFTLDGRPLANLAEVELNEVFEHYRRGVSRFSWNDHRRLLLRYVSDPESRYVMGIFKDDEMVEIPRFGHGHFLPNPIQSEGTLALLSPDHPGAGEAIYWIRLCAGKYRVTARSLNEDKRNYAKGSVAVLNRDGAVLSHLISFEGARACEASANFFVQSDSVYLFRVRAEVSKQLISLIIER